MKTLSDRVRLVLLALMAFSLNAVVSAGTLSAQTSFGNSTADLKAGSLDLLQQLTLPVVVGQMEQACPAIPELSIPAYNWWSEGTNGYQAPDAYFVILPPSEVNDPGVTVFPQAIGLAATWDPVLHQEVADVTATEARERFGTLLPIRGRRCMTPASRSGRPISISFAILAGVEAKRLTERIRI